MSIDMVPAGCTVLLLGPDQAALEGLAQALTAAGCRTHVAGSLLEAACEATAAPPLVALVHRRLALTHPGIANLPLAPGGALVLYGAAREARCAHSPAVQRATLADLTLPLERHRLLALLQHLAHRALAAGRPPTPAGGAVALRAASH